MRSAVVSFIASSLLFRFGLIAGWRAFSVLAHRRPHLAVLNATFGNAVELLISILALRKGELNVVRSSMLGSILSNCLLVMGGAFFAGGLRFHEQGYSIRAAQLNINLLGISGAFSSSTHSELKKPHELTSFSRPLLSRRHRCPDRVPFLPRMGQDSELGPNREFTLDSPFSAMLTAVTEHAGR